MCQDRKSFRHTLPYLMLYKPRLLSLSHHSHILTGAERSKETAKMMTKPLLLLVALTLCCCIATLHAVPMAGCLCIRTTSNPVALRVIEKIEVRPISGRCRRTEIIITRKNGSKICVNPKAVWVKELLSNLQRINATSSSTTVPSTASTVNY
ncbi:growth-regulated alpha protein [Chaetodon auriga]|uniref:growth-regulated alpha protein n=1 Tax=Chaetodon auriga TaxID=39042 RepID=UPI0040331280